MSFLTQNKNKGFTMVELIVVVAVLAVLMAVLVPSVLKYVENSRMESDNSAMGEVAHSIKLAMSDGEIFDEICAQAVPNNYMTFSDSNSVYGEATNDEEFWAPDGAGYAMTVTFMPNDNGEIVLADGVVNNVAALGGTTGDGRYINPAKQCKLKEMPKLYAKIQSTLGTTITEQFATYKNSAYTVFIELENLGTSYRPNIYGEWNGTNLSPDCPKALPTQDAPSTEPPVNNGGGQPTQPSQPSQPQIPDNGGGSGNNPTPKPETPTPDPEPEVARIPAGAVYYVGVHTTAIGDYSGYTAKYVEGDPFPKLNRGDVYLYEDYEYRYGYYMNDASKIAWTSCPDQSWNLHAIDLTKTSYTNPLSSINGQSIIDMGCAYSFCSNMQSAPTIPTTVKRLYGTYYHCTSLAEAPTLPNNIRSLTATFSGCSSLRTAPVIPSAVSGLAQTFRGCTSLNGIIEINAQDSGYDLACFIGVNFAKQNITITGTYTDFEELFSHSTNACIDCRGTCKNNH